MSVAGDRQLEAFLRRVDRRIAMAPPPRQRRRRPPRERRRDPNYSQLPQDAGKAIERVEVQRWAQRLGRAWEVIPRRRFGNRFNLASIFRGQGRPDMVAVNRRTGQVLVGDVTTQPNLDHQAKTLRYARHLAANLPQDLAGFRVLAQEWYWGLPPEWGRRGSWPTSPRWPVTP